MAVTSKPESTTETLIAGWLAPDEFSILEALCDILLPSLEPPVGSSDVVAAYCRRSGGDLKWNILKLMYACYNMQHSSLFSRYPIEGEETRLTTSR